MRLQDCGSLDLNCCLNACSDVFTLQVARREAAHPTADELAHRDEQGLYSASEPFWARVKSAALLTAPGSDRRVRGVQRRGNQYAACEQTRRRRPTEEEQRAAHKLPPELPPERLRMSNGLRQCYHLALCAAVAYEAMRPRGADVLKHPCRPQVLHMGVDVSGSFMSYWPGDSLGVRPRNDPAMVDALLERLDADGAAVFSVAPADDDEDGEVGNGSGEGAVPVKRLLPHLNWPCTLREAFAVRDSPLLSLHPVSVLTVMHLSLAGGGGHALNQSFSHPLYVPKRNVPLRVPELPVQTGFYAVFSELCVPSMTS